MERTANKLLALNQLAVKYAQSNKINSALKCLKQAQSLLKSSPSTPQIQVLKAVTAKSFGNLYKKKNCYTKASKYYTIALSILDPSERTERGEILLKLSSTFSLLGKHFQALEHALKAFKNFDTSEDSQGIKGRIVALYNSAVEYEYIQDTQSAYKYHKQAYESALEHLGAENPLTTELYKKISQKANQLPNCSIREKTQGAEIFGKRHITGERLLPMTKFNVKPIRFFTPRPSTNRPIYTAYAKTRKSLNLISGNSPFPKTSYRVNRTFNVGNLGCEEVKVRHTQEEVEVRNTQEEVGVRRTQEEVEVRHTKEEVDVRHTQEEVKVRHTQEEVEVRHIQEEVKVRHTQEEVEVRHTQEEEKAAVVIQKNVRRWLCVLRYLSLLKMNNTGN